MDRVIIGIHGPSIESPLGSTGAHPHFAGGRGSSVAKSMVQAGAVHVAGPPDPMPTARVVQLINGRPLGPKRCTRLEGSPSYRSRENHWAAKTLLWPPATR